MFLRRLSLTNIRSIGDLEMRFETPRGATRPWTFVLGENGAGKSTVLRSIALVLAGSEALPEVLGEHDWWIREGEHTAEIQVELATAKNERRIAKLVFRRGSTILRFLTDNQTSLEELDAALAPASRNYFTVGYGVSRRAPVESRSPSIVSGSMYRTNRAQNVSTLFSPDSALVSLESWAIDLDYRHGARGLDVVRRALDGLLPDVSFDGVDKDRRRLRFRTPDGALPLDLLSDGYQAMAAWCGDLLYRITETFANYEKALNARGLLLIDELDLHLHPIWQRQLVTFLRQTLPNFQFVTTTHSPLTVHQAGEGELFILKRPPQGGASEVTQFEGAPNKLMLHQLIQSPLFGLETLDSPQTAQLRREIRALKGMPQSDRVPRKPVDVTPATTPSGRAKQIKQREAALASVADWKSVPDYLKPTNALLERIASELDGEGADRTAVRRVVRTVSRRSGKSVGK